MSNEEGPKKSLRDIAARAKEARNLSPTVTSAQDLLGAMQARPSSPPPASSPPGALSARPSAPPGALSPRPSSPPGGLPPRPSSPPDAARLSAPPASLPPRLSGAPAAPLPSTPPPASSSGPLSTPPSTQRAGEAPKGKAAAAAEVKATPAAAEESKGSVTPILVGVGLVAAIGLGVVFTRKPEPPLQVAATTAPPVVSAAPEPKVEPKVEPKAEPSAAPAPSDSGVVDINALAAADASGKAAPRASGPMPKASDKAPDAPPPATTSEPVASAAPRVMGSVGELHDEMRKRAGSAEQGPEQADTGPGRNLDAKQEKPSSAAVLGALGAVRSAVKACIADTDKPSRISVTFQSDGSVRSVSVSGGAAGKPAEACVVAAVKKARVAPFVAESFSTSFSVSP